MSGHEHVIRIALERLKQTLDVLAPMMGRESRAKIASTLRAIADTIAPVVSPPPSESQSSIPTDGEEVHH